jgi:hypothetical protein
MTLQEATRQKERALRSAHKSWVASCLSDGHLEREPVWTESIAVGPAGFVAGIRTLLGPKAYHRSTRTESKDTFRIEDAAC